MKLEEVITIALTYLGDEMSGDDLAKSEYDDKIKLLVKCANIMLAEIATDYLPLTDEYTVVTADKKFSYENLPRRVLAIKKITDEKGNPVRFRQRSFSCITDNDGRFTVEYNYLPAQADLKDDCDVDTRVSEKTLALGACAEYCMINGMYEQSLGFSERFRQDMRKCVRPVGGVTLKGRGWY